MPTLLWALTCSRVITDSETNAVSYIDALEGFAVSDIPIPFPPVCVSTLWRREGSKDKLHVRIRIQDPAGKTIVSFEPDLPKPLPKKRHRLNIFLGGTMIHEPGEFLIIIEQQTGKRWKRESTLPIDVTQIQQSGKRTKKSSRRKQASRN